MIVSPDLSGVDISEVIFLTYPSSFSPSPLKPISIPSSSQDH